MLFLLPDERGAPLTRPYAPGVHLFDVDSRIVVLPFAEEDVDISKRPEGSKSISKPSVAGELRFEDHVKEDEAASGLQQNSRFDVRHPPRPPMYQPQPDSGG